MHLFVFASVDEHCWSHHFFYRLHHLLPLCFYVPFCFAIVIINSKDDPKETTPSSKGEHLKLKVELPVPTTAEKTRTKQKKKEEKEADEDDSIDDHHRKYKEDDDEQKEHIDDEKETKKHR